MKSYDEDNYDNATCSCVPCILAFFAAIVLAIIGLIWALS